MFQNKVVRSITNCFGLLEFFHGSNNMNYGRSVPKGGRTDGGPEPSQEDMIKLARTAQVYVAMD